MKIFFLIIITFLTIILMVACSNKDKTDNVHTITVWAHEGQPEEKAALESIFLSFNTTHKNIQVKVEFKQEQGYGERVAGAAMAGSLPDLLEIDGPYTSYFADNGILSPISLPDTIKNKFLPTIISQGSYKNKLYTLGAFESTIVIYYNPDIIKACGLTPPDRVEDAWRWPQFIDALEKVKASNPGILPLETFMVWGGEWLTYAFSPIIWSNKGSILSPEGTVANGFLNSSQSIEAMTNFQTLFTRKLTDKNAPAGQFLKGRAAMAWGVFNRWPLYKKAGIPFAMMPIPSLKIPASPSGSWCWGITASSKNREAAQKVLLWLVSPASGVEPICRANGGVPARLEAEAAMEDYVSTRSIFVEQLKQSARSRPATPQYAALTRDFSRAISDIAGGAPVKETLDKASRSIDAVLSNK